MNLNDELDELIEEIIPQSNHFIIMWCSDGLECIIPLDLVQAGEQGEMLAKLEGRENTYAKEMARTLEMLQLRARVNFQRHYEIYTLTTEGSMDKPLLETLFETDPQMIVNLIREKGVKIFSDRAARKPTII
jgi:hypothetical protein